MTLEALQIQKPVFKRAFVFIWMLLNYLNVEARGIEPRSGNLRSTSATSLAPNWFSSSDDPRDRDSEDQPAVDLDPQAVGALENLSHRLRLK